LTGSAGPIGQSAASAASVQNLSGLIHDARNMVAAMELYCDLLEEPGVLSASFRHYAKELRLVSGTGQRLLEKLALAESKIALQSTALQSTEVRSTELQSEAAMQTEPSPLSKAGADSHLSLRPAFHLGDRLREDGLRKEDLRKDDLRKDDRRKVVSCSQPVTNLAEELRANHNLLSALVGHGITVELTISGGEKPVLMSGDDLTRVLVNLARNAAEAMGGGGHLQIALEEGQDCLSLSFSDNGPGIPEAALEGIFRPGYSTRVGVREVAEPNSGGEPAACAWPVQHRGLGLSIVRSIVAAAGGSAWAVNRTGESTTLSSTNDSPSGPGAKPNSRHASASKGAVLVIEFPLLESPAAT
jgi:signal transduction histidine kinase